VRIKALVPEFINFDYVDEGKLDVNIENSSPAFVVKEKEDIFTTSPSNCACVSPVLYVEFTDGELRPTVNRKNR
jgi:hypothetical protein